MAFLTSAVSRAEGERDEMRRQLMEKKRQCRELLQQMTALKKEHQLQLTSTGGRRPTLKRETPLPTGLPPWAVTAASHTRRLPPFQAQMPIRFRERFMKP